MHSERIALPMSEPIKIFVGTDRSQELALRVLSHSIRTRTNCSVEINSLGGLDLPEPPDPKHKARTGFSFARFAIPELAGRKGRAIYLDADMLVFRDITELWNMPFSDRKLLCQEALPDEIARTAPAPGARRRKQCSVMLLDCERLDWDASEIIAGLGPKYTYDALLSELCILPEEEVGYDIPVAWNSLEHLDQETRLIHYTDMMTQPWVCASNPNGWIWVDEIKSMIEAGSIEAAFIDAEIAGRYARPSLSLELKTAPAGPRDAGFIENLINVDRSAGFKPHAALAAGRPLKERLLSALKRLSSRP